MSHPYSTGTYAESLSHWGEALQIPEWGCHVITQQTAAGKDAVGTYPLAILCPDADLAGGLERLRRLGMICVTLVLDEFHRPPLAALRDHFQVVHPFKQHYIRRNSSPFAYARHHRYEVRRSLARVSVGPFELGAHLAEWAALYAELHRRHALAAVHDFAPRHFETLSTLEGTTSIGAWLEGKLVSAHLWVSDGRHVHSHLAASSDAGYGAAAAYAVYDASVRHFEGAELLNFGGGAGAGGDSLDGLSRFKSGFANDSAPAYVCGAILDPERYHELVRLSGVRTDTLFFPAYRARTG
jgi:hypothetical protein